MEFWLFLYSGKMVTETRADAVHVAGTTVVELFLVLASGRWGWGPGWIEEFWKMRFSRDLHHGSQLDKREDSRTALFSAGKSLPLLHAAAFGDIMQTMP